MKRVEPEQGHIPVSLSAEPLDDQLRGRITGIVMSHVDAALMSTIDRYVTTYTQQAVQQRLASLPPTVVDKVAAMVDLQDLEAAIHRLVEVRVNQVLKAAGFETDGVLDVDDPLRRAQQKVTGPVPHASDVRFGGRIDQSRGHAAGTGQQS